MSTAIPARLHQPTPISDVQWPRRTNKACCNCRRDKIKCDGERPCSACLRRGLTEDRCIDGCPPCRRSRARCDGADPCSRCIDMGVSCSDEPPSPTANADDTSRAMETDPVRSAPTGRARLACQACRRDNKKCDNNRPCTRCISRMEDCIHVERIPKAVKHRCINCRKDNKKCEDSRPCRHCVDLKIGCSDAPRKGAGGTRVKMACYNCRRNKVQCDSERPCRVCVRRGLECTIPSCTCVEVNREPGSCSFCRSQRPRRNTRTTSDYAASRDSEEIQSEISDIPSPVSPVTARSGEFSDYHGDTSIQPRYQDYGHQMPSQETLFLTNDPLNGDSIARASYLPDSSTYQDLPRHNFSEMLPTKNSFEYHTTFNTQGSHRNVSTQFFSHHSQQGYDPNGYSATSFSIPRSDAEDESGLNNFMQRNLDMGMYSHSDDSSAQSSLIPQDTAASASLYADAMGNFSGGVGVGDGTRGSDGPPDMGGLLRSCGPAPMAMPISMTIPVPRNAHSHQSVDNSSVGQIDMHRQLRWSAYYLTSDSRTVQYGDGS